VPLPALHPRTGSHAPCPTGPVGSQNLLYLPPVLLLLHLHASLCYWQALCAPLQHISFCFLWGFTHAAFSMNLTAHCTLSMLYLHVVFYTSLDLLCRAHLYTSCAIYHASGGISSYPSAVSGTKKANTTRQCAAGSIASGRISVLTSSAFYAEDHTGMRRRWARKAHYLLPCGAASAARACCFARTAAHRFPLSPSTCTAAPIKRGCRRAGRRQSRSIWNSVQDIIVWFRAWCVMKIPAARARSKTLSLLWLLCEGMYLTITARMTRQNEPRISIMRPPGVDSRLHQTTPCALSRTGSL